MRLCLDHKAPDGAHDTLHEDASYILLATLFLGSFCGKALAWGDTAHQVICEVAFRLAKPAMQAAIQRLINSDPSARFPDFSESCVFPDHPRIRSPEHFLKLPRDSAGLSSDQCPLAQKCVLTAIRRTWRCLRGRNDGGRSSPTLLHTSFLGTPAWKATPLAVAFPPPDASSAPFCAPAIENTLTL